MVAPSLPPRRYLHPRPLPIKVYLVLRVTALSLGIGVVVHIGDAPLEHCEVGQATIFDVVLQRYLVIQSKSRKGVSPKGEYRLRGKYSTLPIIYYIKIIA